MLLRYDYYYVILITRMPASRAFYVGGHEAKATMIHVSDAAMMKMVFNTQCNSGNARYGKSYNVR